MQTSAMTSKGQVTIPAEIRQQLGLQPGDKVGFILEENHILLFRKQKDVTAAFGIGKPKKSASLKSIEEAIRKRGKDENS